ncbi:hypothetical protein [Mucilaginibacter polytrichastri]|uniref:Adhesin n=1 Tax=Mucilaginibacter polytrichastri TaxID=1302689 RepID=A0A1Q5ZXP8_9SPHI|nr:hypothetical protein [Mucilaginibacter polytrichastri]OKS86512.1 hypothetical protein RG47T_1968 [Mucilaginibacter polytrichastri]SFS79283.1 hypothetical protein SAMN04487890_10486 [Mucilaginibacter polytrichastri]
MGKKATKQSQSREQLKDYFRNGKIPTEKHYADLINSMVHKMDDGFSKDEENGLNVSSYETSRNLVSFYKDINEIDPFYIISKDEPDPNCLKLQPFNNAPGKKNIDNTSFFFHTNGKFGIGKKCDDKYKTEVNGFIGMQGRIGTYKTGTKPANGEWHTIIDNLDNCQAFEIVARTGKMGSGKFAVIHATAVSAYGPKGSKIRKNSSCRGFFWNKINLRWKGTTHNYRLEMRTNSHYADDVDIYYTVTKLWDDTIFLNKEEIY